MYDQIARNNRASFFLVFGVIALLLLLGAIFAEAFGAPWWFGLAIAAVAAVVTFLVSYYGGGGILLRASGARRIEKADHPQLFNVVEEMAIAAGLPLPAIYLIEDAAPNAFATGRDPRHAAVAITRGLLEKLDRDELQGVMAHELAHIKNYDIRLAMLLAVLVGSIALMCDFFLRLTWWSAVLGGGRGHSRGGSSGGGGQIQLLFWVIGLVFAILAPIFAGLMRMAVSRRREYLADATAALLTRYPDGLASALEKIAGDPVRLTAANRATQHLFIVNPLHPDDGEAHALHLFDTHPPLDDRVRRLREMGLRGAGREQGAPTRYAAGESAPAAASGAPPTPGIPGMPFPLGVPGQGLVGQGTPPAAGGEALVPPAVAAAGATPVAAAAAAAAVAEGARPPCPRCQEPLAKGKLGREAVLGCRECGGAWLPGDLFERMLREAPAKLAALDRHLPNLVGEGWDDVEERFCPLCRVALAPEPCPEREGCTLNRCPSCRGLWFDDGELTGIAEACV